MEQEFSKKKQLGRNYKPKNIGKLDIAEDAIQGQCNDTLNWHQIKYIRIPDWLWKALNKLLKSFAGNGWRYGLMMKIMDELSKVFGGMPDNVCFIKISDTLNLALLLELKSKKGKLHGKQNTWYRDQAVQISRDPDTTITIVQSFIEDAEKLKEIINQEKKGKKLNHKKEEVK